MVIVGGYVVTLVSAVYVGTLLYFAAQAGSDPGAAWDEFSYWFEGRCHDVLAETFAWAEANTGWLCDRVGEHFVADAGRSLPRFAVGETAAASPRSRPSAGCPRPPE